MNVVVAGAGRMGSQIACEYAIGGHKVTVVGRTPQAARDRIDAAFGAALHAGIGGEPENTEARQRVTVVDGLRAVEIAPNIVVESIVEDEQVKGALLREVAERWPRATIASNTSALSITTLGRLAGADDRVLGAHYWNPPLLMPLVEIIAGDHTELSHIDRMVETLRSLGKRPALVARDVPGFVWNRLQFALVREAAWIVENGVAAPEVVDEIVRDGLARRWRFVGPFETMALGGVETFQRVADHLFSELSGATSLTDVERHFEFDATDLETIRAKRDAGLLRELILDRQNLLGDEGNSTESDKQQTSEA